MSVEDLSSASRFWRSRSNVAGVHRSQASAVPASRRPRSPTSTRPSEQGQTTCRGIVQAYLDRARAYNGVAQLRW